MKIMIPSTIVTKSKTSTKMRYMHVKVERPLLFVFFPFFMLDKKTSLSHILVNIFTKILTSFDFIAYSFLCSNLIIIELNEEWPSNFDQRVFMYNFPSVE